MKRAHILATSLALLLASPPMVADDVSEAESLLCTAVQVAKCLADGGECTSLPPWELNVPQFIEIDLGNRRLGAAAGALIGEIADNDAGGGAAWGAAAGAIGGRRRARRRQQQATQEIDQQAQYQQQATARQIEDFKKAFSVCLEAKKYLVKM